MGHSGDIFLLIPVHVKLARKPGLARGSLRMRLAIKGTLAFLALYMAVLAGAGLWVEYQLRSLSVALVDETARLMGSEIAKTVSDSAREQLIDPNADTRRRLDRIVADLTEQSDIVTSIAVVDNDGRVVASDKIPAGQQLALPQVVFGDSLRVQAVTPSSRGGDYHLFVPLTQSGSLVGYVRLSLKSRRLNQLYMRTRRRFFFAAMAGLAAVAAFALLLHLQLTRSSRSLAMALQAAVRGDAVDSARANEFAQALEVAQRVGQELTAARHQHSQVQRRLGLLMEAMNVGVLLLDTEREVDFANPQALELLGCSSLAELERHWPQIRAALDTATRRRRAVGGGGPAEVDAEVPSAGGVRQLRVEQYALAEDECEGSLLMLKSRDTIDALENELGLAMQMRGLARFYAAFAHDLKAPLQRHGDEPGAAPAARCQREPEADRSASASCATSDVLQRRGLAPRPAAAQPC